MVIMVKIIVMNDTRSYDDHERIMMCSIADDADDMVVTMTENDNHNDDVDNLCVL
jgi:hypothetical protein